MNEQIGLNVNPKAACPYYGGLSKDGKGTYIQCGNDELLHQHPEKDPKTLYKNERCLGLAGSSPYSCRAFLMQSIEDKQTNIASDVCIPELQEFYDKIQDRPGCGDCEYYWWSAGYDNAADYNHTGGYEAWKEWRSRKISCEEFTHYCRPEYNTLHKITEEDLWFCVRKPQQNESEENNMQEKITNTATNGNTDLSVSTPSTELMDAAALHHRIMAGIEVAANALIDVCRNLKTMRDKKLYTQLGYENFEDYAEQAVGMKRRQAYNYIQVLEKLPSSTLQDNAHIGITKLEILSQVPALDREGFLAENDVDGMPVREMEELVKKIKDQGEQLSMLGSENERLKGENTSLQSAKQALDAVSGLEDELTARLNEKITELDNVRDELAQARARAKELEDRPVEVAVQEPDEETLAKIREEARSAAEAEAAAKIKKAEETAKSEAAAKIKKIQSEQDARIKKAEEQAAKDAAVRLQKSLDAAETDKAEALKRAIELEKQLKIAGDPDAVLMQHYFTEIQRSFGQIVETIEKKQDKEPDFAKKYAGALSRALDALKEKLAGQTNFEGWGG